MEVPYKLSGQQPNIGVRLSSKLSDEKKRFHCPVCGKVVFEYYSPIEVLVPNSLEYWQTPLVIQCHGTISMGYNTVRCKTLLYIAI